MQNLSHHGPLACDRCFKTRDAKVIEANGWRLVNDPGLWGASDPVVLILGQSKGNTQVRVLADGEFDRVGFANIRDRLAKVLDRIGVDIDLKNSDRHFASDERDLAFASLLRCSLSDSHGNTSGSPVMHAMDDPEANAWIVNCMDQWLSRPNPRLRLVVLFGLTAKYVSGVMDRLRNLHPQSFKVINNCAAEAAGVVWVFAQHPSRISENHYQRWIGPTSQKKRDAVRICALRALNKTN